MRNTVWYGKRSVATLVLVATTSIVSGCATPQGGSTARVDRLVTTTYYPACYRPVEELRQYEASIQARKQQAIAGGAIVGAVAGGVLGGLLSGDRHRTRNAALGAVAGGVAGGLFAYSQYINDDLNDMDRTLSAAQNAQNCYKNEFSTLLRNKRRGRISPEEGQDRFSEIVAGLHETNNLMATVDSRFGENIASYNQAYESDLQKSGIQRQQVVTVADNSRSTYRRPTSSNVPKEAVDTERKLQQANTKRQKSKQVAQQGNGLVRSFCTDPDVGDWGKKSKDLCTTT